MRKIYFISLLIIVFFSLFSKADNNTLFNKVGELDLTKVDFSNDRAIHLTHLWEVYWQKLYQPDDFNNSATLFKRDYIFIPSLWTSHIYQGKRIPGHGFATYRLTVLLPQGHKTLAIYLREINSSYRLWCNGKFFHEEGKVGISKNTSIPSRRPMVKIFQTNDDTIILVLQIANFSHRTGAIFEDILLGSPETILKERSVKSFYDLFLFGSIFIMSFYHFIIYLMRFKDKYSLYFAIGTMLLAIRVLFTGENIALYLFPKIPWELSYKVEYLVFYLYVTFFALLLHSLYPAFFAKKFVRFYSFIGIVLGLFIVLFKAQVYSHTLLYFEGFALLSGILFAYKLFQAAKNKERDAYIFLAGCIVLSLGMLNDMIHLRGFIHTVQLTPVTIYIYILIQSFILALRFTKMNKTNQRLSTELNYMNANLTDIINERTEEVQQQKEEISIQTEYLRNVNKEMVSINDEILKQKNILENQNINITSGIQTAQTIQSAFLPPKSLLDSCFKEYFILYKPRDIVSGDFYWFKNLTQQKNKIIAFALGDCTGHGVPGAFLTIFGLSMLNEIFTDQFKNLHANTVLTMMRQKMKSILHQSYETDQRESIDIALFIYNVDHKTLEYAGANSPAYIIRHNRGKDLLIELKPTKSPIGIYYKEQSFVNQLISLQDNDKLYLFSDGFQTQFGGKDGKKYYSKRMKQFICNNCNHPMSIQQSLYEAELATWQNNKYEQTDDITVIGLKF